MKHIHPLTGCLLALLLLLSGCESGTESDSTRPTVSFTRLIDNAIVDASFYVEMNASDNQGVDRIVFEVDGVLIDSLTDYSPPWATTISFGERPFGDTMDIRAVAYDDAGNSGGTGTITVINSWIELGTDTDDLEVTNLYRVMTRCDGEFLDFHIETFGTWDNPYGDDGEVDCTIFLDTDSQSSTGLNQSSGYFYAPSDIGADYGAFIGVEGDLVLAWNGTDTTWTDSVDYDWYQLPIEGNSFDISIPLSELDDPTSIDLAVGWLTEINGAQIPDWMPDTGHFVLPVVTNYIHDVITIDKAAQSTPKRTGQTEHRYWRR